MTSNVSATGANLDIYQQAIQENKKKQQKKEQLLFEYKQEQEVDRKEFCGWTGIDKNNFGEGTTFTQNATGVFQAIASPVTVSLKVAGGLLGNILGPVLGFVGSLFGGVASNGASGVQTNGGNAAQQAGNNGGQQVGFNGGQQAGGNGGSVTNFINPDATIESSELMVPSSTQKPSVAKSKSNKENTTSFTGTNAQAATLGYGSSLKLDGAEKYDERVRANVEEYNEADVAYSSWLEKAANAKKAFEDAGGDTVYNGATKLTIAKADAKMFEDRIKYLETELADVMTDIVGQGEKGSAKDDLEKQKEELTKQLNDARVKLQQAQDEVQKNSADKSADNRAVTAYAEWQLALANAKTAEKIRDDAAKAANEAKAKFDITVKNTDGTIDGEKVRKAAEKAQADREQADQIEAAASGNIKAQIKTEHDEYASGLKTATKTTTTTKTTLGHLKAAQRPTGTTGSTVTTDSTGTTGSTNSTVTNSSTARTQEELLKEIDEKLAFIAKPSVDASQRQDALKVLKELSSQIQDQDKPQEIEQSIDALEQELKQDSVQTTDKISTGDVADSGSLNDKITKITFEKRQNLQKSILYDIKESDYKTVIQKLSRYSDEEFAAAFATDDIESSALGQYLSSVNTSRYTKGYVLCRLADIRDDLQLKNVHILGRNALNKVTDMTCNDLWNIGALNSSNFKNKLGKLVNNMPTASE